MSKNSSEKSKFVRNLSVEKLIGQKFVVEIQFKVYLLLSKAHFTDLLKDSNT